jgi:co-chaperonin GroES (HSP10)
MKPLGNNVIMKPAEPNLVTDSGIILQKSGGDIDFAIIQSIGSDVVDVAVNDKVLPNWNKAHPMDKKELLFKISVDDIIAIVD